MPLRQALALLWTVQAMMAFLSSVLIGVVLIAVLSLAVYGAIEGAQWADRKLKARRDDR